MKLYTSTWRFWLACFFAISGVYGLIQTVSGGISCIIIAILLVLPEILYSRKSTEELWHSWDECSVSNKQFERIERSRNGELTPKFVDTKSRVAVFVGNSNSGKYRTTLKKCSCPDFKKRGVPCKHMYYLADQMELLPKDI